METGTLLVRFGFASFLMHAACCWGAGPSITQHPAGKTILVGSEASFRVEASGSEPLYYQWYKDGQLLANCGTNVFFITGAVLTDAGVYTVAVWNTDGRANSSNAAVTVVSALRPPTVNAAPGARVTFKCNLKGQPTSIQWFRNHIPVSTRSIYFPSISDPPECVLANVRDADFGSYTCVASNQFGSVVTPAVDLVRTAPGPLDSWTPAGTLPDGQFYNLSFLENSFFGVGSYAIATSSNLNSWSVNPINWKIFYDVTFGGDLYVAVGELAAIYTSIDGSQWVSQTNAAFGQVRAVAYGNGVFVAAAQQEILYSTNGIQWSLATPAFTEAYSDVAWGADRFVVVGVNGRIQMSTNGVDWEPSVITPQAYLYGIEYGNGKFVAVGSDGSVMISEDGKNWDIHASGTLEWFGQIAFGNGVFVAMTRSSSILSSSDAVNWVIHSRGTNAWISPYNYSPLICFADGEFIAGASSNRLLRSGPIITLRASVGPPCSLELNAPRGRAIQIEARDDFQFGSPWEAVAIVTNTTGTTCTWTDSGTTRSKRFYRASIVAQ